MRSDSFLLILQSGFPDAEYRLTYRGSRCHVYRMNHPHPKVDAQTEVVFDARTGLGFVRAVWIGARFTTTAGPDWEFNVVGWGVEWDWSDFDEWIWGKIAEGERLTPRSYYHEKWNPAPQA